MSKIYVFAAGAEYISVNGVCYKKTANKGKATVDSSEVKVIRDPEDCEKDS